MCWMQLLNQFFIYMVYRNVGCNLPCLLKWHLDCQWFVSTSQVYILSSGLKMPNPYFLFSNTVHRQSCERSIWLGCVQLQSDDGSDWEHGAAISAPVSLIFGVNGRVESNCNFLVKIIFYCVINSGHNFFALYSDPFKVGFVAHLIQLFSKC
jgi:hypothetical protein